MRSTLRAVPATVPDPFLNPPFFVASTQSPGRDRFFRYGRFNSTSEAAKDAASRDSPCAEPARQFPVVGAVVLPFMVGRMGWTTYRPNRGRDGHNNGPAARLVRLRPNGHIMEQQDQPEPDGPQRQPISPAKRKRLQQLFEKASSLMRQEEWDYAAELLTHCAGGDPGNFAYLQSFLATLKTKYGDNKKGSKAAMIKGPGARRAVSKAAAGEDWDGVIKAGLEMLKLNPWDVPTLEAMANATWSMGYDDVGLAYLKTALDGKPTDPHVNRICGHALRERKQYDQAVACWVRVQQACPGDEEANKEIAGLAVDKTITKGGYEEEDADTKMGMLRAKGKKNADEELQALPPEERLKRAIAKQPQEMANYIELADFHLRDEAYGSAEKVLAQAVKVSDGDPDVRERWEDARMRFLRNEVAKIDQQLESNPSDEAKLQRRKLRKTLNDFELDVYKGRTKRHPHNLAVKFDLAIRHQLAGQYNEAITQFQLARNDSRRKGLCMLALGQCFEKIKQPRLAMKHYQAAVTDISEKDAERRKDALYMAGALALKLGDLDASEKNLTDLAELDFTYKDVPGLLDKIAELREDGDSESPDD